MKCITWALMLSLMSSICLGQTEYGQFQFDGYARDHIVYLPENFEPGLPLVLNLHGYGMEALDMPLISSMNNIADTAGFVVAYPNAVNNVWNSGIGDSPSWPAPDVDDISYISALIDTLYTQYEIDTNRVYSCGFSNGGFMSFRLALELGERIQKVASVVGVVTPTIVAAADSTAPIPVLCMLGTEDPVVPFAGGVSGWYSGSETVDFWVEHNQCSSTVDSLLMPDFDPFDDCTVTLFPYSESAVGSQVIYYRIEGGGHKWPSGFWYEFGGAMNFDIHGSQVIWDFFNIDSFEISGVWVHDLMADETYLEPGMDTLSINAAITNTDGQAYEAHAILRNMDNTLVDSFQLFDDGLHNDGEAGDGLAGAFIPVPEVESHFNVQATTLELDNGVYLGLHDLAQFTTIGPLIIESVVQLYPDDGEIQPGTLVFFDVYLQNIGSIAEAANLRAVISAADTMSRTGALNRSNFPNLAPGVSLPGNSYFGLHINENAEIGAPIYLNVQIYSQDILLWEDTGGLLGYVGIAEHISGLPVSYNLVQNYPNPFNPSTTISFTLPQQSKVKLTVFDIQGREVMILQDNVKASGNYEVQWEGMDQSGNQVSTGVYFCRLNIRSHARHPEHVEGGGTGSYSRTIKMVYLR